MSRADSPYVVGDYWLDKRRDRRADGKPQEIWQIAVRTKRSVVYRSTHCRDLEGAKSVLDAHFALQNAQTSQTAEAAEVAPLLVTYWKEKGTNAFSREQIALSLRAFIGFLMQDTAGVRAVVTDLTPALFERFRKWRMGPHGFAVPWGGRTLHYESKTGVGGATVQRHISDIRAAVNYARDNLRIARAPKIKNVDRRYKSRHRNRILTLEELSRIVWYSCHNPALFRFVTLQLVTSVRPMAAARFDPRLQYDDRAGLIDTQPFEAPQTKKRNAVIPAVRPFRVVLRAWTKAGANRLGNRKTAWRIMRRTLHLDPEVQPKTIRYTIATWLYEMDWVPERQISEMLGHIDDGSDTQGLARISRIYVKYRPEKLGKVVKALSIIWMKVSRATRAFGSTHLLATEGQGRKYVVKRKNVGKSTEGMVGAAGIEPATPPV